MNKRTLSIIFICLVACGFFGAGYVYHGIFKAEPEIKQEVVKFTVEEGATGKILAENLEKQNVIKNKTLFLWYLKYKGADKSIHRGEFMIKAPFTIEHIVNNLQNPSQDEVTLKIIPGWDLRKIAEEIEKQGVATKEEVYKVVGEPAVDYRARADKPTLQNNSTILKDKPDYVSFEGYFRPDTYRFFKDVTVEEIFNRLIRERQLQLANAIHELEGKKGRTVHEVMTMASILEREVRGYEDKKMVADIFWKRHDVGMGLQADSTVHYATGKTGDVFTTNEDRQSDNLWNTYKYPKLPPGPIGTPSLESIDAAANPTPNDYWYFLTDIDTGEVRYAETLDEHNRNVEKYIRN